VILAGMCLLSVGGVDLVRRFAPARRRWVVYALGGVLLLVLSAGLSAFPAAVVAALVAAGWVWSVPLTGTGRAGLWPPALLLVLCAGAVLTASARPNPGPLGRWPVQGPIGEVSLDVVVAAVGATLFLLESGNLLVRTALRQEEPGVVAEERTLRGGRLIGPLERVLVFGLTLAGAYTLLAAVLAAKGIVRFPEISGDKGRGTRAEYFLVGSLVSWVTALAAALLVWWGSGGGWAPLL